MQHSKEVRTGKKLGSRRLKQQGKTGVRAGLSQRAVSAVVWQEHIHAEQLDSGVGRTSWAPSIMPGLKKSSDVSLELQKKTE